MLREERAQAVVEMVIVAPVMLVVALIVYNVMLFAAATARFDRVAPDIVLAHGVSPSGGERAPSAVAVAEISAQLEQAMGEYAVEIEVCASDAGASAGESLLTLVGSLRTYTCTMRYAPWPSGFSLAGVAFGAPAFLIHERAVTVDPWRPGVVL